MVTIDPVWSGCRETDDVEEDVFLTKEKYFSLMGEIFRNCLSIMKRKNADYAAGDDPFRNFRLVEVLRICSTEKGIIVRMSDKLCRIANLIDTEAQVKDEAVEDTLDDLINYAAILRLYRKLKRDYPELHAQWLRQIASDDAMEEEYGC